MIAGRKRSTAYFIAFGGGLVAVIVLLYLGWVVLNWRSGILLVLGILLLGALITGVVLNTLFLVREIQRNEQHNAFINAVTHELKTPVASIRLYLETLQARQLDDAQRAHFYSIMLQDTERLLTTIEQVLRTGRIGSRILNVLPVELGGVVEGCLGRARSLLPSATLEYVPGPPLTILADRDEVQAAVSNLLDNALKYSGPKAHVRVDIARAGEKHVSVRVKDNGPGIPQQELKRIFKRFYRMPGPLATRVKGTGLGLFIVRSVARRHGGRAWAESEGPGRGSTFVLELPIAR